jgi:hypothetical protein
LLALCGAVFLAGCGGENVNPVGAGLVNRKDLGGVIRLSPISPSRRVTEFLGVSPTLNGLRTNLVAGSLNRIEVTALLRFIFPTDTLLARSGGQDISVVSARVRLVRRPRESVGEPQYTVWETRSGWGEQSIFADTTRRVEAPVSLVRIDSVRVTQAGDTTAIDLPASFVRGRFRLSGRAANEPDTLAIALQAGAGAQFVTSWVSTDVEAAEEPLTPHIDLTLRTPDGGRATLSYRALEDTFYGVRQGSGPDAASLTVGTGIRYWTYLTFALPDSLPRRATINSARLEAEVAQNGSFPADMVLGVERLVISPATGDTSIAQGGTAEVLVGATSLSVEIGPIVVQAWTSGQAENHGVVLLPVGGADLLSWVALRNPRLAVVYSVPPGTE